MRVPFAISTSVSVSQPRPSSDWGRVYRLGKEERSTPSPNLGMMWARGYVKYDVKGVRTMDTLGGQQSNGRAQAEGVNGS